MKFCDTVYSDILVMLSVVSVATPGQTHRNITEMNRPCSLGEYVLRAKCVQVHSRLVCTSGLSNYWVQGIKHGISYLRLVDWPGECFNVSQLEHHYPELSILELVNSTSLRTFKGHFSAVNKIKKLNIHGMTSLWEISPEVIMEMKELKELDVRGNMLRHIKSLFITGPRYLDRIYLEGNDWDCSDGGLDWLAMEPENGTVRRKIIDFDRLVCHQQLYRGKPLNKVMNIIRTTRDSCPKPCGCTLTHVVSDVAGAVIPIITVDCSNRQLDTPPASLPPGTTTLRLEGNKLNTIRAIVHNPQYKRLADLYLDNNSISAVKELEGTEWFTSFRVLSLRGNLLKQIPVYAFDKALQANNNIMHVLLGDNPWRCDCHYIPRFQSLLMKYRRVIRDLPDIRCSASSDKNTALMQISTIPLGNVCSKDVEMPISTINIVNVVLIALLLLVLGRFLYDWHTFKTTGKLPWLSSVLP